MTTLQLFNQTHLPNLIYLDILKFILPSRIKNL